jgi:hypothetical protein
VSIVIAIPVETAAVQPAGRKQKSERRRKSRVLIQHSQNLAKRRNPTCNSMGEFGGMEAGARPTQPSPAQPGSPASGLTCTVDYHPLPCIRSPVRFRTLLFLTQRAPLCPRAGAKVEPDVPLSKAIAFVRLSHFSVLPKRCEKGIRTGGKRGVFSRFWVWDKLCIPGLCCYAIYKPSLDQTKITWMTRHEKRW